MTSPENTYVDINVKTRNLKNLLKKIKPLVEGNKFIYRLKENNLLLELIVVGGQRIIQLYRVKKDRLSDLIYRQKELIFEHANRKILHIYWDGEYYRLKLFTNPLTIKIVVDKINDP
ncbi:MAG: hypothetical protein J7L82_05585 [Staphylothermus sp.]|nr:hypothetical protein [Staphylothermus sp.]